MNVLNTFFDQVYVITCLNCDERREYIQQHLKNNRIKFNTILSWDKNVFSEGDVCAAQKSLISSHIRAILDAKINGFNKILICEDDAFFPDNFDQEFTKFIKDLPEDWDFLQLGNQFWAEHWVRKNKEKENLYRFYWGTGSHGIGINKSVFDITINLFQTYKEYTDKMYYELFSNTKCYCPEKFLIDALSENSHLNYFDSKQIFKSTMNHKKFI